MTNVGYYPSRNQIIYWINDLLKTSLTKIEQLGSGNIYCHLLDAAYPQKVPMGKVKWTAYLQVDFIHNFKILQTCFEQLGINKCVDIQKLCKAKYQDNLEFIQWMKRYLESKIKENSYDPLARRQCVQINLSFCQKNGFDLKNTLNNTVQVKLISAKSVPTIRPLKVKHVDQNQTQLVLSKGYSIKNLIKSKVNVKTSALNNLTVPAKGKENFKGLQAIKKIGQPLLNKTNLVKTKIVQFQDQECF